MFADFEKTDPRKEKESKLKQGAKVLWFTGLSGSGKTTLSTALERKLFERGFFSQILDGDNIRAGINNNLGFSNEERIENIRRVAEVAKLFLNSGIVTICAFISPTQEIRHLAQSIVGKENFYEVFVSTPIEECEKRDTKGLYPKARAGIIKNFTGVNAPFEHPTDANLSIDTTNLSIEECVEILLNEILPLIQHQSKS